MALINSTHLHQSGSLLILSEWIQRVFIGVKYQQKHISQTLKL